jgi:hypothetical protein
MSPTRPCVAALAACAIAFGCSAKQAASDAERATDASAAASDSSIAADAPDDAPAVSPSDASLEHAPVDDADADASEPHDAGADAPAAIDATYLDAIADDGGACNALANTAPPVPETMVPGEAPAATGGAFVPGLYYLTKWEIYTGDGGASGPTGNTRAHVMNFRATTYDEVLADNGGTDQRSVRTWSFSGTSLDSQQLCPTVEDLGDEYTATPTTLVLQAYGVVFTLTKQ